MTTAFSDDNLQIYEIYMIFGLQVYFLHIFAPGYSKLYCMT